MNRPLVPEFIKNLDKNLLLHKPATWSTRAHFVIFYSVLFMVVLAAICFMSFSDPRSYSTVAGWTGFVALVSFIGLVVWLIYLLRFNVFKRFGVQKTGDGLKTFALLFVSTLFIVLPCFVPSLIESYKANRAFTSDEMANDINSINEKICQINYNQLTKEWNADTLQITAVPSLVNDNGEGVAVESMSANQPKTRQYIDTARLRYRMENADSMIKLTDSLYVELESPHYTFVSGYEIAFHSKVRPKKSKDIYYEIIKNYKPVDRSKIGAELDVLLKKYRNVHGEYYSNYYERDYTDTRNLTAEQRIRETYKLNTVESGLFNIANKKYNWDVSELPVYARVLFYTTFCITLLVFIFRHSTIKTFFLSLLTAVVLFILSGMIIAFSSGREEHMIFSFLLFYYAVFFVITLLIFNASKRDVFKGIALNLVAFFTAFIPLIAVALYYSYLRESQRYLVIDYAKQTENADTHYLIAEIGGVLLFIILLEPLIKKLYRKWYSLPEN